MNVIEDIDQWRKKYAAWQQRRGSNVSDDLGEDYPFIKNRRAPFTPARRALPMLNLGLISSAGAYIDGTEPFDTHALDGDFNFKEIPVEVDAEDLRYAARGYDPTAVLQDRNAQIPIDRLFEFERNGIIGQLNAVFWSFCGFVPDASRLIQEASTKLVERLVRQEVQAALLVPASLLCHQSVGLLARMIESAGIPTITLSVDKHVAESVRPPRVAFYDGELGSVAGKPNFAEHQRRVLDEALRLIEPMDQPGLRILAVELQSQVQKERGER